MKKSFVLLLFLGASAAAHAGIGLGLKAGANFATQNASGVSAPDFKTKTGFLGGVYANVFFGKTIGIQPEVLFSQKGAKISDIDITNNITYIDIPILLRIRFLKILDAHVGPQFGILASATQEGMLGDEDFEDMLKNSEVSMVFGAGVNLPLRLNVTARYILGLTDITDVEDIEIKNNTFQLTLGFRILGK
jgi:hypothetical protein